MKLRNKILSLIVVCLLFVGVGNTFSQGLFKNQTSTEEGTSTTGGILRADPPYPPGGNNDVSPGNEDTPVGEGLLILSVLGSGYFMLKKKNSQK